MSTEKTVNYQLHRWTEDDEVLMQEFNENFQEIDNQLKKNEDEIANFSREAMGNFVAAPNGTAGLQFSSNGLTASWTPNPAYVNGHRFDVPAGSITLNPNQEQYIYLDSDGVIKKTTSQATAETGLLLWYFATDTSQVITSEDRRNVLNLDAMTVDQTLTLPTSNPTGRIRQWLSWFANMITKVTGKPNWWNAPATTLEAANNHMNATTGVHGATSAATANAIMQRDASGRAKVAAPSASDDIARKDTVDAVQTNLNNHKNSAVLDHPDGSVTTTKIADNAVTDTKIGNRTADPAQAPSGLTGTLTQWLSWITNRIKAITGKTNWYDTPRTTLENTVKRDGDIMTGSLTAPSIVISHAIAPILGLVENETGKIWNMGVDGTQFWIRPDGTDMSKEVMTIFNNGIHFPRNSYIDAPLSSPNGEVGDVPGYKSFPQNVETLLKGNYKYFDLHGEFDTTTGKFTAQVAGLYLVVVKLRLTNIPASGEFKISFKWYNSSGVNVYSKHTAHNFSAAFSSGGQTITATFVQLFSPGESCYLYGTWYGTGTATAHYNGTDSMIQIAKIR